MASPTPTPQHELAGVANLAQRLSAPARGSTATGGYCAGVYNVTEEQKRVTLPWNSFKTSSWVVE